MNTPESDHTPDRRGAWGPIHVSSGDYERRARLGLVESAGLSPAGAPLWSSTAFADAVLQLAVESDSDAITVLTSPFDEVWPEVERAAEALAIRRGFPWPPPDRGTGP